MNIKRLKPYMFNTLLTIALCAAYCLLGGILGMLTGLLISALLALVLYHEHYGFGAANAVLILVIFTMFHGVLPALTSGVPLILLALALVLGTRLRLSLYQLLLLCSFLFVADLMLGLKVIGHMSGGDVTFSSMMLDMGRQIRETMAAQYTDPAMEDMLEQVVSAAVDMSIMLAPAMFMIISAVLSYVLIFIFKRLQQRRDVDMAFLIPFDRMQSDKLIVVVYLALVLLLTAAPEGLLFDASANVLLVLSFMFVVLGLSVFDWKMKQRGTQRMARRLILFGLICVSTMSFMLPVMALLICGATDCFFDYRHLRAKKDDQ